MELNIDVYNSEFMDENGEYLIYCNSIYIGNVKIVNIDKYINYLRANEIDTRYIRFYKNK
jgi:hypothetical protein